MRRARTPSWRSRARRLRRIRHSRSSPSRASATTKRSGRPISRPRPSRGSRCRPSSAARSPTTTSSTSRRSDFCSRRRRATRSRIAQARDLHFMIGDSLARLERYKEAEPYLEEEVRLYPQHVRARAGLAMLYPVDGTQRRGRASACRSRARRPLARRGGHGGARLADVRPSRPSGGGRRRGATKASRTVTGHEAARPARDAFAARRPGVLLLPSRAVWWWTRACQQGSSSRPTRIATSCSSPSTRCARMRMSAYGGRASTPHLDALAARGARFTFAHAHAVVTLPSHTSLLTGTYPYEHGVRDNNGYRVKPETATLATRLKAPRLRHRRLRRRVPARSALRPERRLRCLRRPHRRDRQHRRLRAAGAPRRRSRHRPRSPGPARSRTSGSPGFTCSIRTRRTSRRTSSRAATPSDPYAGEVAWTDYALGPLFDRLASLPRKTLVIVTADHGESLGDHGELTHGIFAYEPTLRVPLIVAELGAARPPATGVTIDTAVRHVDLVPTILEVGRRRAETTACPAHRCWN